MEKRQPGLIDLLGEQYAQLRRTAEERWAEQSETEISSSEWFLIGRIGGEQPAIAEVARQTGITRQAAHKLIKKLLEKGLVEVSADEENKKARRVRLTGFGTECLEKNERLKHGLEQEVEDTIGAARLAQLKVILAEDWGMDKERPAD
ncbi:MarR family winged helix-turn-helix transcriptional regulator [Edaphobacillus lindanitolerans]|uniref:DNA-binding transcriptional regulator, MarR family n=1 Tax=Edaphobacillus lindanitolerans TaxID=550447 RepID=A0A1U7PS67_9BACI|nr:MarR family transcriptional regulator [Edaphobacillus lindanitolerans]SIT88747.1 DNA-binding transcriptional regulator, MarR family [Edaphobacillus lindanitolerans]